MRKEQMLNLEQPFFFHIKKRKEKRDCIQSPKLWIIFILTI